jgi:hypothetical protein
MFCIIVCYYWSKSVNFYLISPSCLMDYLYVNFTYDKYTSITFRCYKKQESYDKRVVTVTRVDNILFPKNSKQNAYAHQRSHVTIQL